MISKALKEQSFGAETYLPSHCQAQGIVVFYGETNGGIACNESGPSHPVH
jgi:hypothetical protein